MIHCNKIWATPLHNIEKILRCNAYREDISLFWIAGHIVCQAIFLLLLVSLSCSRKQCVKDTPGRNDTIYRSSSGKIPTGVADDKWNVDKWIVKRHGMSHQMFLTQMFSMVSTDNNQCTVENASITQLLEKGTDKFILIGDFRIVHAIKNAFTFLIEFLC